MAFTIGCVVGLVIGILFNLVANALKESRFQYLTFIVIYVILFKERQEKVCPKTLVVSLQTKAMFR